jgi:glycosyltransferase involved in cell wall biosynthesis
MVALAWLFQHVSQRAQAGDTMTVLVTVVIPALNAGETLPACLNALKSQTYPRDDYEVILVDGNSSDFTREIGARFGAKVLLQEGTGRPAARNTGINAASGEWVVFTDADCFPARTWLSALVGAAEKAAAAGTCYGGAGKTIGYMSSSPAARYVDHTGGLDAEKHLSHPRFPCAPTSNLMYRRDVLLEVNGFDERYHSYAFCELHYRLCGLDLGQFVYVPNAVVLHLHRQGWQEYWKQQVGYGRGYAQFMLHHRDQVRWTVWDEMKSIGQLIKFGVLVCMPSKGDEALLRKGNLIKNLAQKVGFVRTYWSRKERSIW